MVASTARLVVCRERGAPNCAAARRRRRKHAPSSPLAARERDAHGLPLHHAGGEGDRAEDVAGVVWGGVGDNLGAAASRIEEDLPTRCFNTLQTHPYSGGTATALTQILEALATRREPRNAPGARLGAGAAMGRSIWRDFAARSVFLWPGEATV